MSFKQSKRGGNLRRHSQQLKSAAGAGAKQAAIGGASGYLGGAKKAEQKGGGPTKQILGGLRGGIKGAVNRGSWGAKRAYQGARAKNQQIPNEDLRRHMLREGAKKVL